MLLSGAKMAPSISIWLKTRLMVIQYIDGFEKLYNTTPKVYQEHKKDVVDLAWGNKVGVLVATCFDFI